MAKVNVEFDTMDKTISVSIDGKGIENVCGASFHKNYGYDGDDPEGYMCSISTCYKDETTDLSTYTSVTASESIEGKKLVDNYEIHDDLPGFKITKEPVKAKAVSKELISAVASFFGADSE